MTKKTSEKTVVVHRPYESQSGYIEWHTKESKYKVVLKGNKEGLWVNDPVVAHMIEMLLINKVQSEKALLQLIQMMDGSLNKQAS